MAEENTSEGFTKSRPVLGDVTNLPGKRGFSERGNIWNKSFSFNENDEDLAKRIRVSSGHFDNNTSPNMNNTSKGPDSTDLQGETPLDSITTTNEISAIARSKFVCLDLKINGGGQITPDRFHGQDKDFDGDESKVSPDGCQSDVNEYRDHDGDFGNSVLSQCGSMDGTFLPESQESKVSGVELNTGNEFGSKVCEGTEPIKDCSCSFCTKAGYIWLDLNYQDIKARVSALRKSQKEASIQAERIIMSNGIEKCRAESFSNLSKLEPDLMYLWRSLFQNTVAVIEQESNQLEARLLPLNILREKCKTDLELIGAARPENR